MSWVGGLVSQKLDLILKFLLKYLIGIDKTNNRF